MYSALLAAAIGVAKLIKCHGVELPFFHMLTTVPLSRLARPVLVWDRSPLVATIPLIPLSVPLN